jgi:hypothetical protein
MSNLSIAAQAAKHAANDCKNFAKRIEKVAAILESMHPEKPDPIPELAKALHPLDLCLMHREAVKDCLTILQQTKDVDGLSAEGLAALEITLEKALKGGTQ